MTTAIIEWIPTQHSRSYSGRSFQTTAKHSTGEWPLSICHVNKDIVKVEANVNVPGELMAAGCHFSVYENNEMVGSLTILPQPIEIVKSPPKAKWSYNNDKADDQKYSRLSYTPAKNVDRELGSDFLIGDMGMWGCAWIVWIFVALVFTAGLVSLLKGCQI